MSIVGSVPELDCEPFFCNCISSGVVNNGDRHLSEHDDGGECLILEADDCACCVPNNGDVEASEPEGGGEYTTLNTDDCACCVLKNGDGDLSESEDDGVYLILDADDCTFCVYPRMKKRTSPNLKMMFYCSFLMQLMGHVIGYNLEMEYLSKCGNLHSSVM